MAEERRSSPALQAMDSETTSLDPPSNIRTTVRRRRLAPNGLIYITPESNPRGQERLEALLEIVCQVIWINAIGLNTLMHAWTAFPEVGSRDSWEQYKKLLTNEEISFADESTDLHEPRMQNQIAEYVRTLAFDKAEAFVKDNRPSEFYSDILRTRIVKYNVTSQLLKAIDGNLEVQIPRWYDHCLTKHEYVAELTVEDEENRHRLKALLKILEILQHSIQRAVNLNGLKSESEVLKALKIKMGAFGSSYMDARSLIFGDSEVHQHLINTKSERWWLMETDSMPENYKSETITKVDKAFQPPETMRLILNFIIPIASLLSTIPAALAWRYGGVERGTTMDSDFYQAIAGMMLQFLSLITFWPSLSDPQLSIKSRFLIWTLAVFSGLSSLVSVPLYLVLSTTWSFIVTFIGGVAQAILQLQVINSIMWPSNYKKLGTAG